MRRPIAPDFVTAIKSSKSTAFRCSANLSADVRNFLRGPRGTAAKLLVERYGTGKREEVEIIRDAVPQPSIAESYMIRPGVGYIAMTGGFNQTTYAEFVQAMQ